MKVRLNRLYHFSLSEIISVMAGLTLVEFVVISFFDRPVIVGVFLFIINAVLTVLAILQSRSYNLRRTQLISEINISSESALNSTLGAMPVGVIRYNEATFDLDWFNPYAALIFETTSQALTADTIKMMIAEAEKKTNQPLSLSDKNYQITHDVKKHLLYLMDVTGEMTARSAMLDRRPVLGSVSIDNYSDLTEGLSEGEVSHINSFVVNFLDHFASENQIYLKRLTSDRFVFFTNYRTLSELMADSFQILDSFRTETAERKIPLALSIGVSYGVNDFAAIGRTALHNMELAMVRGGDQVVIRENVDNARAVYFGGNSESRMVKSRTRARAIATALRTIVSECEKVFIVGHSFTDMDALGAAVAMKNFAQMNGKEAFVVYQPAELLPDVERAITALNHQGEDLFEHIVRLETAKEQWVSNSLLIMVDHSKVAQTLDREFYDRFEKVVVIDHHRRDEDFPKNVLLSYIESSSSSASEMAVEVLQFQDNSKIKMTAIEASVILAGISVDTKSFSKGTTAKTFEAASYLREQGADNDRVARLLATDFEDYKRVNQIVIHAEFVVEHIAIALGKKERSYEKVTLAKAANQLLDLDGVDSSFVLALSKSGTVLISARSRGSFNVQAVMEMMGGGGHFNTAATEISGMSLEEAKIQLVTLLKEKIKAAKEASSTV